MKPSEEQKAEILSHVRYEIAQCFVIPRHDQNDGHIRESVYLAMLIHARNLLNFFESAKRKDDDVLCSDFGFPTRSVEIDPKERKRFNKDMVHLTYSRLRHTPDSKPWPVLAILQPLVVRAVEFMTHVVSHPPVGADTLELKEWNQLVQILSGKGT